MQRIISWCIISGVLFYGFLWALSIPRHRVEWGISFSHTHAAYLGLPWREVYVDMLKRFSPKYVRVAALWNEVGGEQDRFDFSSIDFMMDEAAKHGAKVTLVLGQKAPRWPECHIPAWAGAISSTAYESALASYLTAVVEHYKEHPALELWQVENEPFIDFKFGECPLFRDLVSREVMLVRGLDLKHNVMITDSGELSTWRKASSAGDILGTTLYRVVQMPGGNILKYDWLPPSVYSLRARLWGKYDGNWYVAEAQAEPWFASEDPRSTPIAVQEKTFSPKRFLHTARYIERTGASRAYWWGVEWWYYAEKTFGNSQYLKMADSIFGE